MKIRIATYNLFEGAPQAYNRLVDFIRASDLDILCFQEVNNWQNDNNARMHDFSDKAMFTNFAYGNSNTEYKLATFSKLPFTKSDALIEGYWHSVVETRVMLGDKDLTIYNLHLDPWQESSREREVDRILRTLDPTHHVLIVGDFNSLSRSDNYPPEMIAEMQRRGITKYGRNELEYGVTDYLSSAGFVDIAAQLGQMDTTVPTSSAQDRDHEVPVRVDYMFASPSLAQFAQKVEVVKTELTNVISDHFPLIVTFEDTSTPHLQTLAAAQPAYTVPVMGGILVIPPDAPLSYDNLPAPASIEVYNPPEQTPAAPPKPPIDPTKPHVDENDDTVFIIPH